ncbi:MAG: nucleotide exchange factor GrpE [Candidatus Thermoplasmatota archaeon]|nr:nucleotide exchange factor GrpE [Candidatus Thermoplasmatota archaeon]
MTGEPVEEPEAVVSEDEEEDPLAALETRVEELEKDLQYSAAEMVNVRQRAARDRSDAIRYGGMSLALRMLPLLDSLEKALEAAEGEDLESLGEGVRLTLEGARAAMESEGVVKIEVGSEFDPTTMEAIATVPLPNGHKAGSVIEIVEVGYMYHDRILRAARVIVAEDE